MTFLYDQEFLQLLSYYFYSFQHFLGLCPEVWSKLLNIRKRKTISNYDIINNTEATNNYSTITWHIKATSNHGNDFIYKIYITDMVYLCDLFRWAVSKPIQAHLYSFQWTQPSHLQSQETMPITNLIGAAHQTSK